MGAVMNSETLVSETNEQPTKGIEMKELPKLCQSRDMTMPNDEVDGIIPTHDSNNNMVYDIKRSKISCRECQQKSKAKIVDRLNQRQSNQQSQRYEYARQTSRGS